MEGETLGFEQFEASEFEVRVIVIIQIINPNNFMPCIKQALADMRTDKARRARYQKFHSFPHSQCSC
ncbi:Uncharacterised protein [Enterobacter cloacae]|nr:Uncharacterised protein [Enterobacter cloacae]